VQRLRQIFSLSEIKSVILATLIVVAGLVLAVFALALGGREPELSTLAAILSLVFVLLMIVFVLPPLARSASREARNLSIPFEFTVGGAIMLSLIIIVGFSAWNTGNNLLFLILALLISILLISYAFGWLNLRKIDLTMRFPEAIYAGEDVEIRVQLKNNKRLLPIFSVLVEIRCTATDISAAEPILEKLFPRFISKRLGRPPLISKTLSYFPYLKAGESLDIVSKHKFPERGRFVIRDFELISRFPFSFFSLRRQLPARATELYVLPKVDLSEDISFQVLSEAGRAPTHLRGVGQDLLSIREYLPTDDLRRIDWKATAKRSEIMVREFSLEEERKFTIILDRRLSEKEFPKRTIREIFEAESQGLYPFRIEKFEKAVSLTASVLSRIADERSEMRLVLGNDSGEFGIGGAWLLSCLRRLAATQAEIADPEMPAVPKEWEELILSAPVGHYFLIISGFKGDFEEINSSSVKLIQF
jgi:uncharacterized protein (DUF58 family)